VPQSVGTGWFWPRSDYDTARQAQNAHGAMNPLTTIVSGEYFRVIQFLGLLGMAVVLLPYYVAALRPYGRRLWLVVFIVYLGAGLVLLLKLLLN
jgi:hypothetical protein